jgi:glycosyltransferase involved in cell wall biosynthesis
MPAFNAERWVARAIESVLDQTYSDWELIVVDDGSVDNTEGVVRGFSDPRIRFFRQENRGPYHSRNTGLNHATGEYIALLDADDWYEPEHLKVAIDFLEKHPDCALVGTNFYFLNRSNERTVGCKPKEIRGEPGDGIIEDYFRAAMRNRCFPITNCAVFRRARIADLGAFDETLLLGGDHEFWFRWAMRSTFGYIDTPTCYYLVDTAGSARKNLALSIRMRVELWKKLSAIENDSIPHWNSYRRCKSFYLFRLAALSIAAGYPEEAKKITDFWRPSPRHLHWWLGRILIALPPLVHRSIHAVLGRTDLVKYRQGRPVEENHRTPKTT